MEERVDAKFEAVLKTMLKQVRHKFATSGEASNETHNSYFNFVSGRNVD